MSLDFWLFRKSVFTRLFGLLPVDGAPFGITGVRFRASIARRGTLSGLGVPWSCFRMIARDSGGVVVFFMICSVRGGTVLWFVGGERVGSLRTF